MGRTRGQSLVAVDGYGRMAAVGLHCCPRISTNENPAFARFDASHASPFDVTVSDFKLGIPKGTPRESAAEIAYARSYEEPTPGSGDRPFCLTS